MGLVVVGIVIWMLVKRKKPGDLGGNRTWNPCPHLGRSQRHSAPGRTCETVYFYTLLIWGSYFSGWVYQSHGFTGKTEHYGVLSFAVLSAEVWE